MAQPDIQPAGPVISLFQGKGPPPAPLEPAWPDIEGALLDDKCAAVPAFPLELLPAPWRLWIAETGRSVNVPADYVAQAVLAAVAGLCGAGVWVCVSPVWREPLSLWLAVVGPPSSGKSPALHAVRRLVSTLESEASVATAASAVEFDPPPSLKRRAPRIFGSGSVQSLLQVWCENDRGVLLWRDEPEGCFSPLVAGAGLRTLDPYPASILGSLEPERLAATVQRGEESLAARFLYAWPAPPPFQPLAGRTPARDDEALAMLRAIHRRAGRMAEPLYLDVDESGLAILDRFLADLHAEQRSAEGLEAAWLGKGQGVVPRLAATLHLLEGSADPGTARNDIGRETFERAVALWSGYYRRHARAFFDRAAPGDVEARARRTVRWLKACGFDEISREDVRRTALGQAVNAGEADRVLARLVEAGVLRPVAPEAKPKGGRPALRWTVNPALRLA